MLLKQWQASTYFNLFHDVHQHIFKRFTAIISNLMPKEMNWLFTLVRQRHIYWWPPYYNAPTPFKLEIKHRLTLDSITILNRTEYMLNLCRIIFRDVSTLISRICDFDLSMTALNNSRVASHPTRWRCTRNQNSVRNEQIQFKRRLNIKER